MKKHTLILFFSAVAFFATAQSTVSYSLDTVSRQEFYIVETMTAKATKEMPRPVVTTTPIPFSDTSQVKEYIVLLRSEAKKAQAEAQRIFTLGQNALVKAGEIEALYNKTEWLSGKKPEPIAVKQDKP